MLCVFSFLHPFMRHFSKSLLNTNPVLVTLSHVSSVAGKASKQWAESRC